MGKLRRNLENTHGFAQASYGEILELRNNLKELSDKLDILSSQVKKATFATVMSGADISEFFPVERQEQLELFMDRDHPEWTSRKTEFYNFLFTIVPTSKRGFAKGLLQALFTRKYIWSVKWPSCG